MLVHRYRSTSWRRGAYAALVGLLSAALVVTVAGSPPATGARPVSAVTAVTAVSADEPDQVELITSPAVEVGGQLRTESSVALDTRTDEVKVTIGDMPVPPQCVTDLPAGLVPDPSARLCIGESTEHVSAVGGHQVPRMTIVGVDQLHPDYVAPNIAWLEQEAVDALMTIHGVSDPGIMRGYARPEIRAYMLTRLVDILDKRLYGVRMTTQEQQTYDALMTYLQQRELYRTKAALREYERWEKDPCAYDVPEPPSAAHQPYLNTAHTAARCDFPSALVQAFQFTKGTPPTTTFEAWGSYRSPTPLAKHLADPAVQQSMVNTNGGYAVLGGLGAAAAASVGVTFGVAASVPLYTAVLAVTKIGFFAITKGTLAAAALAGVGGAAAGVVVGAVLLGLVIAAVSIWMIVEEAKIPAALRQRVEQAAQNRDPLGIDALRPAYAGLSYATKERPADGTPLPLHDQTEFTSQLQALVAEWTMFDEQGKLVHDPEAGYDDVPPEPGDIKFRRDGQLVTYAGVVSNDERVNGRQIPAVRLHFSRGYLMVAPSVGSSWGEAQPQTYVRFLDHEDDPAYMSITYVDPDGDGPQRPKRMFLVTPLGPDREEPFLTDAWEVDGGVDGNVTYTLEENPPVNPPISVVPTAKGTMLPGHLVELRAHHNLTSGSGTYSWTVERLAPDGSTLDTETRGNLVAFADDFAQPGTYRVTVRFQGSSLGEQFDVAGMIELEIETPRPEVVTAELVDQRLSHGGRLFLDLELEQATDSDTFEVAVEWADDNRGHRVVEHYTVQCRDLGDEPACRTDPLVVPADAPINPNWSASPVFSVPEDQSFLPFVTLTVTNSHGATVEQALRIDGEHRARYTDRTPYVRMEAGRFNRVPVTTVTPSQTLPGSEIGIVPFIEEISEQLPEGFTPDIEGPDEDGRYTLFVRGEPHTADVGLHSFYYPVDQLSGGISEPQSRPAPAQTVLDIVPSLDPGFRAILSNVPTGSERVQVRGDDPPDWGVQVPYETPPADDPADDPPYTGQVTCTLEQDDQTILEEPCAADARFPWPPDLGDATYTASVLAGPSGDEPVSATPYTRSFTVARIRPTLTREPATPDASTDTIRLAIEDFLHDPLRGEVDPPFSAAGYQVTCRLDEARVLTPCLDGGRLTVPRSPGAHRLLVRVVDTDDGTVVLRTFSWTVGAPPARLRVVAPSRPQLAGSPIRVGASGLLPREDYVVRIGGEQVATGFAAPDGTVVLSVVVPAGLAEGRHQVRFLGESPQRAGQRPITVVRARTLGVSVRAQVARGGTQRVVVRGLVPGERAVATYGGRRVGRATAAGDGMAVITFAVGRAPGSKVVRVTGAYPSRRGSATFRVLR